MQLKNVGVIVVILIPKHKTTHTHTHNAKSKNASSSSFSPTCTHIHRMHAHRHTHTLNTSLCFISDCAIDALQATFYVVLAVSTKTLWVFFILYFILFQSPDVCFSFVFVSTSFAVCPVLEWSILTEQLTFVTWGGQHLRIFPQCTAIMTQGQHTLAHGARRTRAICTHTHTPVGFLCNTESGASNRLVPVKDISKQVWY